MPHREGKHEMGNWGTSVMMRAWVRTCGSRLVLRKPGRHSSAVGPVPLLAAAWRASQAATDVDALVGPVTSRGGADKR